MLEALRLVNCRQHVDTLIRFIPGINTIVGANGAGKSTIPEMLEFALYGAKALRDNAKGYIRDGEKDGTATVVMSIAGDRYQIGRNSSDAKILKNGEPEASYKENVTKYMTALTGVSQAGYRLGHYIRQKELSSFSGLRAGKRQEMIERMLRVNAVDLAIKNIKMKVDQRSSVIAGLTQQKTDVTVEKAELADALLTAVAMSNFTADFGTFEKAVAEARTQVGDLQARIGARDQLERQIADLDNQHALMRADLLKTPEVRRRLADLEAELLELNMLKDVNIEELMKTISAMDASALKAAEMSEIKRQLEEPLEVVSQPVLPDAETRDRLQAELVSATRAFSAFVILAGASNCPTCRREIPEAFYATVRTDLEAARQTAQTAFDEANAEYSTLLQAYKTQLPQYSLYDAKRTRRAQLLDRYVEVAYDAEEHATLKAEYEANRATTLARARVEGSISKVNAELAALNDIRDRLASSEIKVTGLVGELSKCEDLRVQLGEAQTTLTAADAELKTVQQEDGLRREKLARLEGRIEQLQATITKAEATRVELQTKSVELLYLRTRLNNFMLFKRYMTAKIRPKLQDVAETLFHKVTKNRFANYTIGAEYDIIITTHKGFQRKLSAISGSENDLANLCLRLAIATLRANRLAGSLSFVILDEISSSFDEARTRQTLEGLCELRDVIPQIINITHTPVEMRFADRMFFVEEANEVAKVTWK